MSVPNKIHLTDGTNVDAIDAICEGCNEPLTSHTCGGETKVITVANRSGAGTKHKPKELREKCPHCQGVMHFNESGTATNTTCLQRQWMFDTKQITDPLHDRLPPVTLEDLGEISRWGLSLKKRPLYGKMLTASGEAGTYSAARAKKLEAAKAGEKIEDIAATIELPEAAPAAPKKGRPRKTEPVASVPLIENEELFEEIEKTEEPVAVKVPEVTEAPKRGRGRPRKGTVSPAPISAAAVPAPVPVVEDEYDTAEAAEAVAQAEEITQITQRRGRGRPRKIEAVYIPETAPIVATNGQESKPLTREERHARREERARLAREKLGRINR